ncbi:MAG: serine/threonine-protein kinase [Phycisphaerales bacterium]|nr:serine/threonine-protein kinase [Phycisphaerales bacterium]
MLATPAKIGPYPIAREIGRGGMGVVYLARDTRLDRLVAIKSLPDHLVGDRDRLARFEREARIVASLNHPGIAAVYSLEGDAGRNYLVMEYVEGETLAMKLQRGRLPVDESLDIAIRIAEALEAAHEKGVIHRDLKPGNVMISPEGKVKVLDFGLARQAERTAAIHAGHESPTTSMIFADIPTIPGAIMGTAGYMSPEQARGKPVDKRSDVFSFGCVLYEMLTGAQLFGGETITDSLGATIHKEPDWSALPTGTPPTVCLVLRRCLMKDPNRRLHDIADARIELESAISDPTSSALGGMTRAMGGPPKRSTLPYFAISTAAAVLAAFATWRMKTEGPRLIPPLRKLEIQVEGLRRDEGHAPVISPDGSRIVYAAKGRLWVRALRDLNGVELAGTESASHPFWSPDSAQIGYHDGSQFWRMPAGGGARSMICLTPQPLQYAGGVTWMPDGRIVFTAAWGGPVWEAPVSGGEPVEILRPDPAVILDFHFASALPDGSGVLSVQHHARGDPSTIVLIRNGTSTKLLEHENEELRRPVYSDGHILYGRVQTTGTIWAVPFSLETHAVTGPPFLVAESSDLPSVSTDGTLVYAASTYVGTGQFVWVDRKGVVIEEIGQPQLGLIWPQLSPDGSKAAALSTERGANEIWIHELARGTRRPLSDLRGSQWICGWLGNDRLVFVARLKTYAHTLAQSGAPDLLLDSDSETVSDDGRYAAVDHRKDKSLDIFYFDMEGDRKPQPFLTSAATESEPVIRPRGGWIAYVSDETGRNQVYVTRFPEAGDKWQVSLGGGVSPRWTSNGDKLFFQSDRTDAADLMSVEFKSEPQLQISEPLQLFSGAESEINLEKIYSVSSDGQQILGIRDVVSPFEVSRVTIVENWYREFGKP